MRADAILADNFEASVRATRHLLESGHRRIAHLGDELSIATAVESRRGFLAAMNQAGVAVTALPTYDLASPQEARRAVHELMALPEPPTALFASQNLVTIGAVRALHDLDLQYRVALLGFDDIVLADVVEPPITVMAQDPARIGALAAERVFARLDGDTSAESTTIVPATLVVRGSGEIAPLD